MKKLLPVLLCAAMLLCLLPLEARAAAAAWDGTVDISWYDPAQTEYTIDTPAKLAGLAALVNGMADPAAKAIVGDRSYLVSKKVDNVMLVGAGGGYFYRKNMAEKRIGRTEEYAKKLLDDATRKAAETKKEMEIEAKEEVLRLKTKLDDEIRTRRAEMQRSERRVNQREEMLDKKMDNLEKREEAINQKSEQTQALYDEAEQLRDKQVKELERIAGMT